MYVGNVLCMCMGGWGARTEKVYKDKSSARRCQLSPKTGYSVAADEIPMFPLFPFISLYFNLELP
jgi:hypothetical protein